MILWCLVGVVVRSRMYQHPSGRNRSTVAGGRLHRICRSMVILFLFPFFIVVCFFILEIRQPHWSQPFISLGDPVVGRGRNPLGASPTGRRHRSRSATGGVMSSASGASCESVRAQRPFPLRRVRGVSRCNERRGDQGDWIGEATGQ